MQQAYIEYVPMTTVINTGWFLLNSMWKKHCKDIKWCSSIDNYIS